MGRVGHLIQRDQDGAALRIQPHRVAQIRVLPQIGIKFRKCTLLPQPLLVLEDAQEGAVGLINTNTLDTQNDTTQNTPTLTTISLITHDSTIAGVAICTAAAPQFKYTTESFRHTHHTNV